MAMRWNWRKIGFGSGALIAAISTAYAYSPANGEKMHDKRSGLEMTHQARHPVAYMKSGDPRVVQLDKERILHDAIQNSRALCKRIKTENGLPGLAVAVSVNGEVVWKEGFGLSNVENGIPMKPESVMRIASISKSITMAMLAKLMEEGKIDIDKPIQTYLPNYPEKYVDGEKVTITTRHLLSHLSGIRHYDKKPGPSQNGEKAEFYLQEFYQKEKFESIEDAMKLFQDDELFHKPGSQFLYSTHAWTIVSAIIEKLTDVEFPKYCVQMFDLWGLKNTFLDVHEPIIYNRANYYERSYGVIINSPYVDNSYKWAGGGFLSNVIDLTQFANILIYSMQTPDASSIKTCEKGLPQTPFLKQSTMKTIWTGNPLTYPYLQDVLYALGFNVREPLRKCMFCKERDLMVVSHSGGAMGSSSILLLAFPVTKKSNYCDDNSKLNVLKDSTQSVAKVNGVVVAMITNLGGIGLSKTAQEIADCFKGLL